MSTRSIIARPEANGDTWKGRYCHSDGYPTWMGARLWALVYRDGLEAVVKVLTETHCGWSSINEDRIDLTGVKAFRGRFGSPGYPEHGTPERTATDWRQSYNNGCFENVPGYGIAYTTTKPPFGSPQEPYQQVTEDEWFTPDDLADTDTVWLYVLSEGGLIVALTAEAAKGGTIGIFPWDAPEPDWDIVECGADFERCPHYASVHFPDIPEESKRLDTTKWLGREPLDVSDAVGYVVKGVAYKPTGSGHRERIGNDYGNRWFESCEDPSGNRVDLPVWESSSGDRKLLRGVKAIYPPTYAQLRTPER